MTKLFKIVFSALFLLVVVAISPAKIQASCWNGPSSGPDENPPNESCSSNGSGGASGIAVYSCANYVDLLGAYGCYWHSYSCDTPCGGGPVDPGGCPSECRANACGTGYSDAAGCSGTGPNFGCKSNQACCKPNSCSGGDPAACTFAQVNCESGSTKGTTLLNQVCRPDSSSCSPAGSAQTQTDVCCKSKKIEPEVCGDWYDCPTKNNPAKICRDCTEEVWDCVSHYVNTYECESTCSAVAPKAPTLSSPSSERVLTTTNPNLLWNGIAAGDWGAKCPAPNVNQYKVYVDECAASPAAVANPTTLRYTTPDNSTLSYGGFVGTKGKSYCWKVQATNGSVATSSTTTRRFKISADITGTVFRDVNNNCGGTGWNTGGVSVSLDGGAGNAVTGTGTFAIAPPDALGHTLAVSIPSGYSCSTAAGCNTCSRSGVVGGSINNFYLTAIREAWWRVQGAPIYAGSSAGGITVRSEIPIANYPLIQSSAGAGTSGALIRGSGSIDVGVGTASNDAWNTISKYKGKKMDYQYFASRIGIVPGQAQDWTVNVQQSNCTAGEDFCYGPATTINTAWTVASGQKYVVFVDGDLRIANNITVATGGFLAFIVKGDVTVAPNVVNVQGLYVIDDNFITETKYVLGVISDDQLTLQGSFVAWGSFSLNRNMGIGNISSAVERFYYRPDLLMNMPEKLKTFAMEWQEVAAGSFDN